MVYVDTSGKQAWYIWLQDWILNSKDIEKYLLSNQKSWITWIPEDHTIQAGLDGVLQAVARWEGETQLILSLKDAMKAAVNHNQRTRDSLAAFIDDIAPMLSNISFNQLIEEAILLGNNLWGTDRGNEIASQLYRNKNILHAGSCFNDA